MRLENFLVGMVSINNFFKNNYKKAITITVVIVFISITSLFFKNNDLPEKSSLLAKNAKYIQIAGQNLKVELAVTPQAQEKGLSGRENLQENIGMLFIFEKPDKYSFWMKDMKFPLDIIWFNEDLKVVYLKKDAQPSSYPTAFSPNLNAKYVLEVMAGFSEKNNLEEGDSVRFLP